MNTISLAQLKQKLYLLYKVVPSPKADKKQEQRFISNTRTAKASVALGELQYGDAEPANEPRCPPYIGTTYVYS